MKARLFTYLILLPIVALVIFTSKQSWINYIGWAALFGSIVLIVYAFFRTKSFYQTKKILLFTFFSTLLSVNVFAMFAGDYNPMSDYEAFIVSDCYGKAETEEERKKCAEYNSMRESAPGMLAATYTNEDPCAGADGLYTDLRRKRVELSKVPSAERTKEQQAEYEKVEKEIDDLMRKCQIQPCPQPDELYKEAVADCWVCDVAALFIEAGDKMATSFFKKVSTDGYALTLLAMGFFCWILMRVLLLIGSFGATDIGKFFTDFFVKGLLVGGIAILFSAVPIRDTADFFVSPFFLFSSFINQNLRQISEDSISRDSSAKIDEVMHQRLGEGLDNFGCPYCENLDKNINSLPDDRIRTALKYSAELKERAFSPTLRNSILCSVCTIYRITTPPIVMGQFLFCSSKQAKSYSIKINKKTYRDWDAVIVGFFLTATFFLISSIFAFYVLDSFVRICFVMILFPFLVVAWAFESTRKYTMQGIKALIHAMGTYIVITIFMVLLIEIFYTMLGADLAKNIADALADEKDAYVRLHDLLTFVHGDGGLTLLACIAILFVSFFMLQSMHGYVVALTGVKLSNGYGVGGLRSSVAMAVAGTRMAQEVFTKTDFDSLAKKAKRKYMNSDTDKSENNDKP